MSTSAEKAPAVVETISRHLAVPRAVLHRRHFGASALNNVTQCLLPLRKKGWTQSCHAIGNYKVEIPGPRAARQYQLPPSATDTRPRPERLQRNLAATFLCLLSDPPHVRLFPREVIERFSWFSQHLSRAWPFFFDEQGDCLSMIRLELSSSPYRIVEKHRKCLFTWRCSRPFERLIDAGRFRLVTIAQSPEMADAIADEIESHRDYPRAKVLAWPREYRHFLLAAEHSTCREKN